MKKLLYIVAIISVCCGVSEGMDNSYSSSLYPTKDSAKCFPVGTKTFERHDPVLWKYIAEFRKNVSKKKGKYYTELITSANSIKPLDLRFATLIEVGNLAAIHGDCKALENAREYLLNIIKELEKADDADDALLIGLQNLMLSYCFIENHEYIPDHMECWNNRGSLAILINLASNIKGGKKSLRNETAALCKVLLRKLEEFGSNFRPVS